MWKRFERTIDHTVRKDPPSLVTVAIPDKHYTRFHAVKNTLQRKEKTDNTPTEKVTSEMKQGLGTLSF